MDIFVSFLTYLFFILCFILIIVILLQSSRSSQGGLFGGGGSQTALGSSTTDTITKFTGILIFIFMSIAFFLNWWYSYSSSLGEDILEELNPKSEISVNISETLPENKESLE